MPFVHADSHRWPCDGDLRTEPSDLPANKLWRPRLVGTDHGQATA